MNDTPEWAALMDALSEAHFASVLEELESNDMECLMAEGARK